MVTTLGCTGAVTIILGLELVGLEAVLDLLVDALVVLLLLLFLVDLAVRELERGLKLYLCWELILI